MIDNHSPRIPKNLQQIVYGLVSSSEIIENSAVEIGEIEIYDTNYKGLRNGRPESSGGESTTINGANLTFEQAESNHGALGHIHLSMPIIHTGFIELIKTAIDCSCNSCGRILLYDKPGTHPTNDTKTEQDYYRELINKTFNECGEPSEKYSSLVKEIQLVCGSEERNICPYCGADNQNVTLDMPWTFKTQGCNNALANLSAVEISQWLERIPDNELIFIGLAKTNARPEWAIMTAIPVPPLSFRSRMIVDEYQPTDDLTEKLVDIVRINQRLNYALSTGNHQIVVDDLHTLLQYHCTTYFDNQTTGIPPARHKSGRPLKTLAQFVEDNVPPFRVDFHRSNLAGSTRGCD